MFPMLLVVGSLVPASDAPDGTFAPAPSGDVATSCEPWGLIRRGMKMNEVARILGLHQVEGRWPHIAQEGENRVLRWGVYWDYWYTGVTVKFLNGRVTEITHRNPRFQRK